MTKNPTLLKACEDILSQDKTEQLKILNSTDGSGNINAKEN